MNLMTVFTIFAISATIILRPISAEMEITQDFGEQCNFDWFTLHINESDILHIASIHLKNDEYALWRKENGKFFFNLDYMIREDQKYMEFFDIEPQYKNGSVDIELRNYPETKFPMSPGKYNITISATAQKRDDTYINITDITREIIVTSPIEIIGASARDRKNITNTIIMGNDVTIDIEKLTTRLGMDNISISVNYQGQVFDETTTTTEEGIRLSYPNITNTILYDLYSRVVCPIENISITLDDSCGQKEISAKQIPPNPSDIYFYVDRYFDYEETNRITQIYYMVGAYFNCMREDAISEFV